MKNIHRQKPVWDHTLSEEEVAAKAVAADTVNVVGRDPADAEGNIKGR